MAAMWPINTETWPIYIETWPKHGLFLETWHAITIRSMWLQIGVMVRVRVMVRVVPPLMIYPAS